MGARSRCTLTSTSSVYGLADVPSGSRAGYSLEPVKGTMICLKILSSVPVNGYFARSPSACVRLGVRCPDHSNKLACARATDTADSTHRSRGGLPVDGRLRDRVPERHGVDRQPGARRISSRAGVAALCSRAVDGYQHSGISISVGSSLGIFGTRSHWSPHYCGTPRMVHGRPP